MRSEKEVAEVKALASEGLNPCEIARRTLIPRSTVRDWLIGKESKRWWRRSDFAETFDPSSLPKPSYAYLLGMYLGDGCISSHARGVYRLRITLDLRYPGVIQECASTIRAVMPDNVVNVVKLTAEEAMEVSCYSKGWPCLFPQHGPGRKHMRKIELVPWQLEIVDAYPKPFLRGLIHSDGCRVINKSMGYEYLRYFFDQVSDDIRAMFCRSCDQLGISYRQSRWKTISIARRRDVAFLDEFVGPKY